MEYLAPQSNFGKAVKPTGIMTEPDNTRFNDMLVAIGSVKDEAAFVAIYDHFAGRVKSFLKGKGMVEEIAEELVQEIMLTIWRRAESYNPSKAAASTWIFTIARNRRIDYLRSNSRVEVELDDALLEHMSEPDSTSDNLEADAIMRQESNGLREAMDSLPNEQQQVLHLSYFRGKSHGDIAEWLDLPVGTVKSRIRLAVQSIRSKLATAESEKNIVCDN